jgi:hypothetical protein
MANTKATKNTPATGKADVQAAAVKVAPAAAAAGKQAQAPVTSKQGKDQAPKEAPNTKPAGNNASPKTQPKNVNTAGNGTAKKEPVKPVEAPKQEPVKKQEQAKQEPAKKQEQAKPQPAKQEQTKKQEQPKQEQAKQQQPAKKDTKEATVKKDNAAPAEVAKKAAPAAAAAPAKDENPLQPTVNASRQALQKFWSANAEATPAAAAAGKPGAKAAAGTPAKHSLKAMSAQKWDAWSEGVRADFLKRCQTAVIASIQTKIPRKQWAQWEITLKFCLEDVFQNARASTPRTFTDKDGLLTLLQVIIDGHENDAAHDKHFQGKIDEMLQQMRDKPTITSKVQGFNIDDLSHVGTLRAIRSLYAIEYAHYVIGKLISSS